MQHIAKTYFTYNGVVPYPSWKRYFSMSKIGETYEVLFDIKSGFHIMSNTEYEKAAHKELFEYLNGKEDLDVLMLGYGIGFTLPWFEGKVKTLDIIEKHEEVLKLTPPPNWGEKLNIIIGDRIDTSELVKGKKFDLIFDDISEVMKPLNLEYNLKNKGKIIKWNHLSNLIKK